MWRPDRHRLSSVILVCCLLHNISIDTDNDDERDLNGDGSGTPYIHDPGYDHQPCRVTDSRGESLREKPCSISKGESVADLEI
ncbi:hypothetical protein MLD38_025226 [Melastoma candidum]|uniref:Uncharacterized protein n=1 Tax=Melastoma candidum TaxID=119954 RepID=A0ACB9NXT1_9MYRT|nr:hypothetical protein MLD38_025226 [Melastoma candidum]